MAYIVGYVTREERAELERRGWDVEDAGEYNLVGNDPDFLVGEPSEKHEVVAIFVDTSVFEVMDGPDWDKGEGAGHDMDRCHKHHNHNCPDCHPMPEDAEER